MPSVTIVPIANADAPRLWTMLQTYLGELSGLGGDAPVKGIFPINTSTRTGKKRCLPFWIKSDAEIAGFALVGGRDDGVYDMLELYIQPDYRRGGNRLRCGARHLRALPRALDGFAVQRKRTCYPVLAPPSGGIRALR